MAKILICFTLCFSILFVQIQTAHAVISETADLAISAAAGLLQTDDKQLEQEIIAGLQNPAEVENLKNYIAKTRPLIYDKTDSFNGTCIPILYFLNKIPLIGGATMSAALNAYIWAYKDTLEDYATTPTLKKFVELREHNIDAGQGLFEIGFDVMTKPYDKDTSKVVLYTDVGLLAAKGKQQSNRYKSSAAAIATILEFAGIVMQPEDVGDICSRTSKGSRPQSDSIQTKPQNNSQPEINSQPQNINPPVQNSAASLGEHWIKDNNGVYLWNPQPNPNETITWSGGSVQDGNYRYANGSGVVMWYLNGEFEQKDEGTFIHGQRDGQFKHTFPSGRVVYSNWNNGVEIEETDAAAQAFKNYHNAITNKNFGAAYDALTYNQQQRMGDYNRYVSGFSNTISSTVTNLNLVYSDANSATYSYELTARDNYQGRVKVMTFSGEVTLIKDGGRWYIDFAKSKKIGEYIE